MHTKTLTAPTIHAALVEARNRYGDDVVLLESIPPDGDTPARVTIMSDQPLAEPARTPSLSAPRSAGFGYAASPRRVADLQAAAATNTADAREGAVAVAAPPRKPTLRLGIPGGVEPGAALTRPAETDLRPARRAQTPAARGRLFTENPRATRPAPALDPSMLEDALESALDAQMQRVYGRLDALDRRLDTAVIGTAHRWIALPLFSELVEQGLRPSTVTRIFDQLANQGVDPDDDPDRLRWATAQALRRLIDVPAPKQHTGTQVFIGPSGGGKTSLLLKLATHASFFGRRRTTVISIAPDDDDVMYQDPATLYRRFDLPTQTVYTLEDMHRALERVQSFDQILIDTPSLPVDPVQARQSLMRLRRMLDAVMPLHVQFVLNTTRALDAFDTNALQHLPLRPDSVALTHLDEAGGWGRVAEWLMHADIPVQFASTSARISDGVVAFSPSWFVESMMTL